ncbi:hypothetical protein V474_19415 [Novosphingobium barchaimii LL02]|uniref:DNA primase/polymerase bifunctional N-terminal domain-containing protein n=2 Tax=Novosphingobium barchaimii TaxID=1420591 RepID=A0A0J8ALQ2_9SPHN|nr:hypothetical protein V474_19415 [Novosphingobium barchaimii LL02]
MPLRGLTKRPFISNWQEFCHRMPSMTEQAAWMSAHAENNIGLPLGPQSGLCMIDIDTDDEAAIEVIKSVLPASPWERRGKKGMALAYRWSGQPNFKIKGSNGSMLIECLGAGNQIVLPPSIHPDTGLPYVATAQLNEVLDDIPELPAEFEARLRAALHASGLTSPPRARTASGKVADGSTRVDIPAEHGIARFLAVALQAACNEILTQTEGGRNTTLFGQAKDLARHVAAAEVEWEPFAVTLAEVGLAVGLTPDEVPASIDSGWKAGSLEPTAWIPIAAQYVYTGNQDRMFHPASGDYLTQSGFNGMHGRVHESREGFSTFLMNGGFVTKVSDITYDPMAPTGVILGDGHSYYNIYRPSGVMPTQGEAQPFVDFLEFLVPEAAERSHLLKVMAHTVREPGERIRHATILRTRNQGVGKSMLIDIWRQLVGGHNFRETSSREMQGNFEGWLKENTLLYCPELNIGHGLSTYNDLKELITADSLMINEKHLKPRRWQIYSTMVFTTNLAVPLLIEADDRRIFFIDSPAVARAPSYYAGLANWFKANIGTVRAYLDTVDLADFNPWAPAPMTEAKKRLINRSATPLVQDVAFAIRERRGTLDRDVVTLDEITFALSDHGKVSPRVLGAALKELGAHPLGQQRIRDGRQSLWIIRNVDLWMSWTSAERIEEYQRRTGTFANLDETEVALRLAGRLNEPEPLSAIDQQASAIWIFA